MTTETIDFTETNEQFADMRLPPVDAAFLAVIQAHLTTLGLTATISDSGAVHAELSQCGQPYALGIFVSAAEVFYRDEEVEKRLRSMGSLIQVLDRNFTSKQSHWVDAANTKLAKYVFVVRAEGQVPDAQFDGAMMAVEMNMYAAPKFVCFLGDLDRLTRSAFTPVAHRAHAQPKITFSRASFNEFDKAPFEYAQLVTLPFEPQNHPQLVEQLAARGNSNAIKALTSQLFRRVMGMDYRLVDGDAWPEVARGPASDWSMPVGIGMLSRGEEMAVTFCLFLALAHDAVTEGMYVGFRESLNAVDPGRQFRMFEVLRDFIAATSASVCLQTDKNELLRLAESRMKLGVDLASNAAKVR